VPGGLWLGTAVAALAVAVGLARSRIEEAAVAIVGLVVFALVFVSVISRMVPRRSGPPGGRPCAIDVPVALLLFAALLAFCCSVLMWFFFDKSSGIFVGLWVPSILSLAIVMLLMRRAGRAP
jgi:hypothetical protein